MTPVSFNTHSLRRKLVGKFIFYRKRSAFVHIKHAIEGPCKVLAIPGRNIQIDRLGITDWLHASNLSEIWLADKEEIPDDLQT